MKSVKIFCFLLFSILLYSLPSVAQNQPGAQSDQSNNSANIKQLKHDHELEHHQQNEHHQQHEHHTHSINKQHHHHHHHHEHQDEHQIVKYETLEAKYDLLKHKALLFFVLAFCLVIFNWLFKKKLKRG